MLKLIHSARAEGLVLQQVIADAPQIPTEFDGVIADDLGPGINDIHIGFGADPRQTGRVSDQRAGEVLSMLIPTCRW